jgi:hypothetical protein
MRFNTIYLPLLKFMSLDSDCRELEFFLASASSGLLEVAEKPFPAAVPPGEAPPAPAAPVLRLFENNPAPLQLEPHLS